MQQTLIHVDSLNGKQRSSEFDYYNCEINLGTNFRNVSNVALKSLELPVSFDSLRENFNK